jgi:hypothetical protein
VSLTVKIKASEGNHQNRRLKMKFSTKVIEAMAGIIAEELERGETGDEGIMGLETNIRMMVKEIGGQVLSPLPEPQKRGRRNRAGCL